MCESIERGPEGVIHHHCADQWIVRTHNRCNYNAIKGGGLRGQSGVGGVEGTRFTMMMMMMGRRRVGDIRLTKLIVLHLSINMDIEGLGG